ncbi:MAG: 2-hydroxyglutaryl-CoA dehydratase [Chloroflexi bacterium]|nr:2-hydroxyglutaryl-CoA dehydratase [Chloroflexota bacterium]
MRGFRFVAGVDVGSLCTKALIWDARLRQGYDGQASLRQGYGGQASQKVVSYHIIRSGALFREAAETCLAEALRLAGLKSGDIDYVVSTGYGRANVKFANDQVTELTCHARGARHFCPDVHTVIDIGGQDSKVIHINDQGQVENFVMNDKCAAGTGRFLEVMAGALQVNLEGLGELSLRSQIEVDVSSMCTVFAESEVISLFAAGHNQADIASAVHRAIARRIVGMVGQIGARGKVAMTGGVAKNIGVVRALEKKLGTAILVPEEPQINGALGAAIIAAERVSALACK